MTSNKLEMLSRNGGVGFDRGFPSVARCSDLNIKQPTNNKRL